MPTACPNLGPWIHIDDRERADRQDRRHALLGNITTPDTASKAMIIMWNHEWLGLTATLLNKLTYLSGDDSRQNSMYQQPLRTVVSTGAWPVTRCTPKDFTPASLT